VLKKGALAGLMIVLLTATTVASAALLEVDQLVNIVRAEGQTIPGVANALDNVDGGGPQTILLIGSDRRFSDRKVKGAARSDTLMLVRLDPDKEATAVMSIPRDLKVDIPGYGSDKINASFSIGGPKLTLETVRNLLGIEINHIIEVNFGGFQRAVNRLGCVYVDVDHRYYHSNTGLAPAAQYAEIDIKPGYQKLCGQKSLDLVRFRHTDSDFVRSARQQDFLRQAKGQFSLSSLLGDRQELVRIFARYTRTDVRSNDAILQLLKLGFLSSKNPVREVRFPATDVAGGSDLGVSATALQTAVDEFQSTRATGGASQTGDKSKKGRKARSKQKKKLSGALPAGVVAAKSEGESQAIIAASKTPMPVYFPAVRLASGGYSSGEPDYPASRAYTIKDRAKARFSAYRIVLSTGEAGQYYGVQGTTWTAPPILDTPSETMKMRGLNFELFYDGTRLRLVALRTPKGVYWVSNTLSLTLTNPQMLAIARSLTPLGS
jgi:polyisoprenyl-teichoic acid--peptidoglycan teichoic acid transferase